MKISNITNGLIDRKHWIENAKYAYDKKEMKFSDQTNCVYIDIILISFLCFLFNCYYCFFIAEIINETYISDHNHIIRVYIYQIDIANNGLDQNIIVCHLLKDDNAKAILANCMQKITQYFSFYLQIFIVCAAFL